MTEQPQQPPEMAKPPDDPDARRNLEREAARSWLDRKWTQAKNCPICGTNNWTVTEVVEIRAYEGGNLVLGGGGGLFPLFQLICNNCGLTHMINAVMSGVVKPK